MGYCIVKDVGDDGGEIWLDVDIYMRIYGAVNGDLATEDKTLAESHNGLHAIYAGACCPNAGSYSSPSDPDTYLAIAFDVSMAIQGQIEWPPYVYEFRCCAKVEDVMKAVAEV